jgi:ribosomal protein S18 acetylase RimI-like enzyme
MTTYRPAELADIPVLMEIRGAVRENRLVALRIGAKDYVRALSVEGRAWVCETAGSVVGFVCGRPGRGDVWALFVRPADEGKGIGTALMDLVEAWLFEQGVETITLSTAPGTRAERFYRRRGWKDVGATSEGERVFSLSRAALPGPGGR